MADGSTMMLLGNVTNATLSHEDVPMPIPARRCADFYRLSHPQVAMSVESLGQKDGYAYLLLRSVPVKGPMKWRKEILCAPVADLAPVICTHLPPASSAR
jgi:hypothetical protein